MARRSSASPNQPPLPSYSGFLVPAGNLPSDIAPSSRMRLTSLIARMSPGIRFGEEPIYEDYRMAHPSQIEPGLFVEPRRPVLARVNTEHLDMHGVFFAGNPKPGEDDKQRANYAVAFQTDEFIVITRNARDLGRATVVKTLDARKGAAQHTENRDAAKRSAGHALKGKIGAQDKLIKSLAEDNETLRALVRHVINPSRYRLRARKLDVMRAFADERIHSIAEVAALTLNWEDRTISGLHRAIRKRTHNGNYSHAELTANLVGFVGLVGVHNLAKIHKLGIVKQEGEQELSKKYQKALDEEKARQEATTQKEHGPQAA